MLRVHESSLGFLLIDSHRCLVRAARGGVSAHHKRHLLVHRCARSLCECRGRHDAQLFEKLQPIKVKSRCDDHASLNLEVF